MTPKNKVPAMAGTNFIGYSKPLVGLLDSANTHLH